MQQALSNVLAVLAEAKAGPQRIVRMTWYLIGRDEYVIRLVEIGAAYRELMSAQRNMYLPAMTAVQVAALIEPQAKVEFEMTAILPDRMNSLGFDNDRFRPIAAVSAFRKHPRILRL